MPILPYLSVKPFEIVSGIRLLVWLCGVWLRRVLRQIGCLPSDVSSTARRAELWNPLLAARRKRRREMGWNFLEYCRDPALSDYRAG